MIVDWQSFELLIMDIVESEKVETAEELTQLSVIIHDHVNFALNEIALDNSWSDYEPPY